MAASRIIFVPGEFVPAPTGHWTMQFGLDGLLYKVNDAGEAFPLAGVNDHSELTGNDAVDQHPPEAITGLTTALQDATTHRAATNNPHTVTKTQVGLPNVSNIAPADMPVSTAQAAAINLKVDESQYDSEQAAQDSAINGKEPILTGSSADGMYHLQQTGGIRTLTPNAGSHWFCGVNEVVQSHTTVAEQKIQWNAENIKHSKFLHSTTVNPSEVTILHTGYVSITYTINYKSNVDKVLAQARVYLDEVLLRTGTSYAWCERLDKNDAITLSMGEAIIPVVSGQKLTIRTRVTADGTIASLGELKSVQTIYRESSLTIKTIVEPG